MSALLVTTDGKIRILNCEGDEIFFVCREYFGENKSLDTSSFRNVLPLDITDRPYFLFVSCYEETPNPIATFVLGNQVYYGDVIIGDESKEGKENIKLLFDRLTEFLDNNMIALLVDKDNSWKGEILIAPYEPKTDDAK